MEISRHEIKALASDTRVDLLKSLGARRKMPSELARELSLAPSTIVEHLQVLERSGLIRRVETGHKWTYYELTEKGRSLVRPKFPVQFAVMISVGLLLVFGSLAGIITIGTAPMKQLAEGASIDRLSAPVPNVQVPPSFAFQDYALVFVAIGMVLIIFASVKLWSKWR